MTQTEQNEDAREAWVLRAGAELWKAVVAEGDRPAQDTQKALQAVRFALDCARRLRLAADLPESERAELSAESAYANQAQLLALQAWGRGRGLNWEADWGIQWGETLSAETSGSSRPTESAQAGTQSSTPELLPTH